MTGYDPKYTPEEDPLDEVEVLGTPIKDFGNFLFFGCMTILCLGIALFFVVGFGIVCGAPGNDCYSTEFVRYIIDKEKGPANRPFLIQCRLAAYS